MSTIDLMSVKPTPTCTVVNKISLHSRNSWNILQYCKLCTLLLMVINFELVASSDFHDWNRRSSDTYSLSMSKKKPSRDPLNKIMNWNKNLHTSRLHRIDCAQCEGVTVDLNQCLDWPHVACVEIAYPHSGEYAVDKSNRDIVTSTAPNVFTEDLLEAPDETRDVIVQDANVPYPVRLLRPSGLQMDVEITDAHLLPEYTDVDHESDNEVILQSGPGTYLHQFKQPLKDIIRNYCRYPLPSWYYIAMKVYRNRQTLAHEHLCDQEAITGMKCPQDIMQGEFYHARSLNEQCRRNRAALLTEKPNAFYCTQNTPLINTMFGEWVNEQTIDEGDSSCASYRRTCEACIRKARQAVRKNLTLANQADIRTAGSLDEDQLDQTDYAESKAKEECYTLNCYNTPACLVYHSPACFASQHNHSQPRGDVCTEGNTFEFSLTPEFSFNNKTFQCHMRRSDERFGLRLRQILSFPTKTSLSGMNPLVQERHIEFSHLFPTRTFDTGAVEVALLTTSSVKNPKKKDEKAPVQTSDGLLDSDLKEAILVASYNEQAKDYQFTLHRLKSQDDFGSAEERRPQVEQRFSDDMAFTTVQMLRPYMYNTKSWKSKGCDLNVSHFVRVQPVYHSLGNQVRIIPLTDSAKRDGSKPNPDFPNTRHTFAIHDEDLTWPTLRLFFSGKRSLIRQFFCSSKQLANNKLLVVKELDQIRQQEAWRPTVQIRLQPVHDKSGQEHFNLTVTGYVTGTPAYLNIRIANRLGPTTLVNQDWVITGEHGPLDSSFLNSRLKAKFHVNYQLNRRQLTNVKANALYDCLLYVVLTDCDGPRSFDLACVRNFSKVKQSATKYSILAMGLTRNISVYEERLAVYAPLFIISSSVGVVYLIILLIYALIRHCSFGEPKYLFRPADCPQSSDSDETYQQVVLKPQPLSLPKVKFLYISRDPNLETLFPVTCADEQFHYNPTVITRTDREYISPGASRCNSVLVSLNSGRADRLRFRRVMLFAHLAFRVFYTFLFTFSVAVSLIFSLQPSVEPHPLDVMLQRSPLVPFSYMHVERQWSDNSVQAKQIRSSRRRVVGPILRLQSEAGWLEASSEQELRRQLDYVDRMKMACQHAVGVEITDATKEIQQVVEDRILTANRLNENAQTWSIKMKEADTYSDPISAANALVNIYSVQQRIRVDQYRKQMEKKLNLRFTKPYRSYADMLGRIYGSGWLRYIQRMINTTEQLDHPTSNSVNHYGRKLDLGAYFPGTFENSQWKGGLYSRYSAAQQFSGFEKDHVGLMAYMGFQQAESIHLLPMQLLADLERVFLLSQHGNQIPLPLNAQRSRDRDTNDPVEQQTNQGLSRPAWSFATMERTFLSSNDADYVEGAYESFDFIPTRYHETSGQHESQAENKSTIHSLPRKIPSHLHALSLTELRLILLALDCVIIVYRFYHTYLTLREIWFGQKVYIDAASVVGATVARPGSERPWSASGSQTYARLPPSSPSGYTRISPLSPEDEERRFRRESTRKSEALLQVLSPEANRYECSHANGKSEAQIDLLSDCDRPQISESSGPQQSPGTATVRPGEQPISRSLTSTPRLRVPSVQIHPSTSIITSPLTLPPPSSLDGDQNLSCLVGIRSTCCRHSHYISAVIGITVILVLVGLILTQEQRVLVQNRETGPQVQTKSASGDSGRTSRNPRLSLHFQGAQRQFDEIIRKQAERLNKGWLVWTRNKELSMRRRLLSYIDRFKHEFAFLDQQLRTESKVMERAASALAKQIGPIAGAYLPKDPNSTVSSNVLKLNSELLFRQQICHFLPVVPLGLSESGAAINEPSVTANTLDYRTMSVQNLLWTALISQAVDFDWSSLNQTRHLTATALTVGLVMLTCIGIVDVCGWMFHLRCLSGTGYLSEHTRSGHLESSVSSQIYSKGICASQIVLISPQPAPIIPWPERERQTSECDLSCTKGEPMTPSSAFSTLGSRSESTNVASSKPSVGESGNPIALTAIYVDPSIMIAPNTIHNISLQQDATQPSVPLLIAHSPDPTILRSNMTSLRVSQ